MVCLFCQVPCTDFSILTPFRTSACSDLVLTLCSLHLPAFPRSSTLGNYPLFFLCHSFQQPLLFTFPLSPFPSSASLRWVCLPGSLPLTPKLISFFLFSFLLSFPSYRYRFPLIVFIIAFWFLLLLLFDFFCLLPR